MELKRAVRLCASISGAVCCLVVAICITIVLVDIYTGVDAATDELLSPSSSGKEISSFSSADFKADLDARMSKAKASMKGASVESEPTKQPSEDGFKPAPRRRRSSSSESVSCCWSIPRHQPVPDETLTTMIAHGNQILTHLKEAKERDRRAPAQHAELLKVIHAIIDELSYTPSAKRLF